MNALWRVNLMVAFNSSFLKREQKRNVQKALALTFLCAFSM